MEQRIKQRLVGAAVLFSLAAIVLPVLFESQEDPGASVVEPDLTTEEKRSFSSRIIPLGETESEAPGGQTVANENDAEETVAIDESADQADAAPEIPEDEPPSGVGLSAWAVQLGSFADGRNATALRDRLRAEGYTAFVEQGGTTDKGTVTRVYVGPELLRETAVAASKQLKGAMKLDGIVVRYPSRSSP